MSEQSQSGRDEMAAVSKEGLQVLVFERNWLRHSNRGRSSDALVTYILGGPEPTEGQYPWDWADFRRCIEAYNLAWNVSIPLAQRMLPMLSKYARHVAGRMDEYVERKASVALTGNMLL